MLELESDKTAVLFGQIREYDPVLIKKLTELTGRFEIDWILVMLQKLGEQSQE